MLFRCDYNCYLPFVFVALATPLLCTHAFLIDHNTPSSDQKTTEQQKCEGDNMICVQATDCKTCTKLSGCVWCKNSTGSGVCTAGNSTGPHSALVCPNEKNSTWYYGSCGNNNDNNLDIWYIVGLSCGAGLGACLCCFLVLLCCFWFRSRDSHYHDEYTVINNDVKVAAGEAAVCGIWICWECFCSLLCVFLSTE